MHERIQTTTDLSSCIPAEVELIQFEYKFSLAVELLQDKYRHDPGMTRS